MKEMSGNIKKSFFLKLVFIYFIVECFLSFYNSLRLDSIDTLINGVLNNFMWFLILYALGVLISGKEVKK